MKLILLPGMDGAGILFQPFLDILPKEIETQIITFPCNEKLSYQELISYVCEKLPVFILRFLLGSWANKELNLLIHKALSKVSNFGFSTQCGYNQKCQKKL